MTYILYNPLANGGNGRLGVDEVQAQFPGSERRDITALDTNEFLTGLTGEDRVILCGGDGTIHRLVNDLREPASLEVPVYIWKFGTGNDFWRDVPEKQEKEMVLLNDYIKNLPVARINGNDIRFVNDCGFGMDSRVCELGEERKREKGERVNYVKLAIKTILFDYKRVRARVTVDGEVRQYEKTWLATTMNGRYVGGGMKLTPGQDRRSDDLCCIVWHGTPRFLTLFLFVLVFSGAHVKLKGMFDVRFGKEIRVEFDRPCAVNLDGEVISGVTTYTAEKCPASRLEPVFSEGVFHEA